MSELTKIFSILLKNLSDALLSTASELSRLDSASPLSQTEEKANLVSLEPIGYTKRDVYKFGDRLMVVFDGNTSPLKVRVSEVLAGRRYLVYCQGQQKSSAREIGGDQILGLDPDR